MAAETEETVEHLPDMTPGDILYHEYMEPYGITKYRPAKDTGMSASRVGDIIAGRRAITVDAAERLSRYFGNSAQQWLNLQTSYERRINARERDCGAYDKIARHAAYV